MLRSSYVHYTHTTTVRQLYGTRLFSIHSPAYIDLLVIGVFIGPSFYAITKQPALKDLIQFPGARHVTRFDVGRKTNA